LTPRHRIEKLLVESRQSGVVIQVLEERLTAPVDYRVCVNDVDSELLHRVAVTGPK